MYRHFLLLSPCVQYRSSCGSLHLQAAFSFAHLHQARRALEDAVDDDVSEATRRGGRLERHPAVHYDVDAGGRREAPGCHGQVPVNTDSGVWREGEGRSSEGGGGGDVNVVGRGQEG